MDLFIVVIAILLVQVWGADNPLHRDTWFASWRQTLQDRFNLAGNRLFAAAILGPSLALFVLMWLLGASSNWLQLPLGVVILLYSFGRGQFSEIVLAYTNACAEDDWGLALERAEKIGVETEGIVAEDWSSLHLHMLEEAAYRGFERMFAVLFWFFIAGPLAAFLYRLIFMFENSEDDALPLSKKVLWLMEWPAVRVLGLSFALTGNFAGCMSRWRESVFCVTRPTKMTIGQSVLGALYVDEELPQNCEVTRKELSLLDGLYRRTLWFWLAFIAIVVIML